MFALWHGKHLPYKNISDIAFAYVKTIIMLINWLKHEFDILKAQSYRQCRLWCPWTWFLWSVTSQNMWTARHRAANTVRQTSPTKHHTQISITPYNVTLWRHSRTQTIIISLCEVIITVLCTTKRPSSQLVSKTLNANKQSLMWVGVLASSSDKRLLANDQTESVIRCKD